MSPQRALDLRLPGTDLVTWIAGISKRLAESGANLLILRGPSEAAYDVADIQAWSELIEQIEALGAEFRWAETGPASALLSLVAGRMAPRVVECLRCEVDAERLRVVLSNQVDEWVGLDEPEAQQWPEAWGGSQVSIDLNAIDHLTSRLINWLLVISQRLGEGRMRLVGANSRALAVLRQMRLDHVLHVD